MTHIKKTVKVCPNCGYAHDDREGIIDICPECNTPLFNTQKTYMDWFVEQYLAMHEASWQPSELEYIAWVTLHELGDQEALQRYTQKFTIPKDPLCPHCGQYAVITHWRDIKTGGFFSRKITQIHHHCLKCDKEWIDGE